MGCKRWAMLLPEVGHRYWGDTCQSGNPELVEYAVTTLPLEETGLSFLDFNSISDVTEVRVVRDWFKEARCHIYDRNGVGPLSSALPRLDCSCTSPHDGRPDDGGTGSCDQNTCACTTQQQNIKRNILSYRARYVGCYGRERLPDCEPASHFDSQCGDGVVDLGFREECDIPGRPEDDLTRAKKSPLPCAYESAGAASRCDKFCRLKPPAGDLSGVMSLCGNG
eukprot:gene2174-3089_t